MLLIIPFEENIEITKKVVEYAHAHGVSVEAELGTVGGQEDDVIEMESLCDPEECKELVEATQLIALHLHLVQFMVHTKVNQNLVLNKWKKSQISWTSTSSTWWYWYPNKRYSTCNFFRNSQNKCKY